MPSVAAKVYMCHLRAFMGNLINHVIDMMAVTLERSYCLCGYHVYFSLSDLLCEHEPTNKQDGYAIAAHVEVIKNGIVIGHLLQTCILHICSLFMQRHRNKEILYNFSSRRI